MSDLYRMTCSHEESKETFTACVVTRDNGIIEGIVRENEHTTFCIKGVFNGDLDEIAFLKVSVSCLTANTTPIVFVFEDAEKGYCSQHDLFFGFNEWDKGWTVKIEKLEDDELSKLRVNTHFKHKIINLEGIAKSMMNEAETLKRFL